MIKRLDTVVVAQWAPHDDGACVQDIPSEDMGRQGSNHGALERDSGPSGNAGTVLQ